jgi:hypothetical protein
VIPLNANLFAKFERPLHGRCFESIEEVSVEVTAFHYTCSKVLLVVSVQDLPKCWEAGIGKDHDYIDFMYFVKEICMFGIKVKCA